MWSWSNKEWVIYWDISNQNCFHGWSQKCSIVMWGDVQGLLITRTYEPRSEPRSPDPFMLASGREGEPPLRLSWDRSLVWIKTEPTALLEFDALTPDHWNFTFPNLWTCLRPPESNWVWDSLWRLSRRHIRMNGGCSPRIWCPNTRSFKLHFSHSMDMPEASWVKTGCGTHFGGCQEDISGWMEAALLEFDALTPDHWNFTFPTLWTCLRPPQSKLGVGSHALTDMHWT